VESRPYQPEVTVPAPYTGGAAATARVGAASRQRLWLHLLLFVLTAFTTTLVGARLAHNFAQNRPAFNMEADFEAYTRIASRPSLLADGLPFSITLLTILLAHELAHYFACGVYRVSASLPYFIPAPTVIGTLGAFIRIRSPIYSKRILFDIGVAGPIAGFVVLVPALGVGIACSKAIPGIAERGDLVFGTPLILAALQGFVFPGVAASDIYLHPVARAAWVGLIATALNLLPIGQADGGHIVYAVAGGVHRWISRAFVAILIPLGFFFWYGWLLWAAVFLILGMRHPPTIYDESRLDVGRRRLALAALLLLMLSFSLTPIRPGPGY
jgi:membrane-associated protease RseP (regulator of RpoE activity)